MSLLKATDFWRPRQQYYANDRIKTLLLQNDKFYICNETHVSGSTFDASKFTLVSGTGSGGTSSIRYSGDWDLNFGGYATLVGAFPDPTKSTGFSTISNNLFQYLGDNSPTSFGGNFYDYVVADGASSIDSGVRSMKVNIPSAFETNCSIFYGVINNNNTVDDLMQVVNGTTGLTVSGILLFSLVDSINGFLVYCYVINNGVPDVVNSWGTRILSPVANEPIYIDLNTATGSFSISITGDPNRIEQVDPETGLYFTSTGNTFVSPSIFDLSNFTTDTFAPFVAYSFDLIGQSVPITPITFDLGTEDDGRLPFLSVAQVIEPPTNAIDGEVYKVVGAGIYLDNPALYDGDYVEFAETLQRLIITRPTKTDAELNNFVLEKIDDQLQPSGIIDTAINTAITDSLVFVEQIINIVDGDSIILNPTTTFVEVNGNVSSTTLIRLSNSNTQPIGKQVIIMSNAVGTISIVVDSGDIQGLPQVNSMNYTDVFVYVLRKIDPQYHYPIWVRIK